MTNNEKKNSAYSQDFVLLRDFDLLDPNEGKKFLVPSSNKMNSGDHVCVIGYNGELSEKALKNIFPNRVIFPGFFRSQFAGYRYAGASPGQIWERNEDLWQHDASMAANSTGSPIVSLGENIELIGIREF